MRPHLSSTVLRTWLPVKPIHWVALLFVLLLPTAAAHAYLIDTFPRAGARRPVAPDQVILRFSEPFGANSEQLQLRLLDGGPVPLRNVGRTPDGRQLVADVPALPDGVYVMNWEVLSTDGHMATGEFAFGVGAAAPSAEALSNAQEVPWRQALSSALLFVGLSLALGGWLSERVVWARALAARAVPPAWVLPGVGLAVLALLAQVLTLAMSAGGPGWLSGAWERVATVDAGRTALIALGLLLLAALLGPLRYGRPWLGLFVAPAAVVIAAAGHGGQDGLLLTVSAAVHLLAGVVWVGAVVHLTRILWHGRRAQPAEVLRAGAWGYARLAAWTVLLLTVAGVLLTVPQFTQPSEVVETRYGQLLLLKVALVAGALLLALVARLRALPHLTVRTVLLRGLVGVEVVLLIAVLGLSGGLVNAAPPKSMSAAYALGGEPIEGPAVRLAGTAGWLAVFVAATEGQLQFQVMEPTNIPAERARLSVEGRRPNGSGVSFFPRPCGRGCFTVQHDWDAGITDLRVHVTDQEWEGGAATFDVPWPPTPDAGADLERVVQAMRAVTSVKLTERVSSGPTRGRQYSFPVNGAEFINGEPFVAGGVEVQRTPASTPGWSRLTLFLPGSNFWIELLVGEDDRLHAETIIKPGHVIERTFEYPRAEAR